MVDLMRKYLSLAMAAFMLFMFVSCGGQGAAERPPADPGAAESADAAASAEKSEGAEPRPEPDPGPGSEWEWRSDEPDHQGLDSAALPGIHTVFGSFPLLSSVIVKNGYIVDEYYKDGYGKDTLFALNSTSKSITSALVGIAIDKGYIENIDVPISEYFPQVLELEDTRWRQITIRHLLTHTSGISTTDNSRRWDEWRGSENWIDYILALPIVSAPGREFHYSTGNTHLLSAILEKAAGATMYEFGKECLFDPVGIESVQIGTDPQGISDGGNGIRLTPYDMARFGLLYLNDGMWEGRQIVPEQWVKDSTSVQFDRSSGGADHGYHWWVRTFGAQHYDTFFSQGHAGQYIFVVPQLELVITFTSDYTGETSIYWQLVDDIIAACTE